MTTALDTREDVSTHADSSIADERDPRMWSRATFATLVSMISISVGSITVIATIHFPAPIAPTAFPNRPPSPFIGRQSADEDRGDDGHSDPQDMARILAR